MQEEYITIEATTDDDMYSLASGLAHSRHPVWVEELLEGTTMKYYVHYYPKVKD